MKPLVSIRGNDCGVGIQQNQNARMKASKIIILTLALSLPVGSLLAQNDPADQGPPPGQDGGPGGPGGGGHGRHHRPPPSPLIMALDANHDGVISADEIANAPAALKTLDKNGDGQLTADELMPPRRDGDTNGPAGGPPHDGGGKHHHPVPPIMKALDTNGDGVISADEIANASASLLKLDKNSDGKLTQDELRPPRPDGNGPDGDGQRPPPPDQNN
jgi:hypothetical protein